MRSESVYVLNEAQLSPKSHLSVVARQPNSRKNREKETGLNRIFLDALSPQKLIAVAERFCFLGLFFHTTACFLRRSIKFFGIILAIFLSQRALAGELAAQSIHLCTAAAAAEEPSWEMKAQNKGVTVFSRTRKGDAVSELKAVGIISAPPRAVFRVIFDHANYKETMPHTTESTVVGTEQDGRVVYFYSLINAPIVSKRDYTIRVVDESEWKDGKGFFKVSWTPSTRGPQPKEGVVRVKIIDGSWLLEPIENGTKTRATYILHTDPGGSVPSWVASKANTSTIPAIFEAISKYSIDPKYSKPE